MVPAHCKPLKAETSDNLNDWKIPSETLGVCKTSRKKRCTLYILLTILTYFISMLIPCCILYRSQMISNLLYSVSNSLRVDTISLLQAKLRLPLPTAGTGAAPDALGHPMSAKVVPKHAYHNGCRCSKTNDAHLGDVSKLSDPRRSAKKLSLCKLAFNRFQDWKPCNLANFGQKLCKIVTRPCQASKNFDSFPRFSGQEKGPGSDYWPAQKSTLGLLGFGLRLKLSPGRMAHYPLAQINSKPIGNVCFANSFHQRSHEFNNFQYPKITGTSTRRRPPGGMSPLCIIHPNSVGIY